MKQFAHLKWLQCGSVGATLIVTAFSATAAESLIFSVGLTAPYDTPKAAVDSALSQLDQPEIEVGNALSNLCSGVQNDAETISRLQPVCGYLTGVTTEQAVVVLKEISAKVNTSTALVVSRAPANQFRGDIASRLAALRRGMQTGPVSAGFRFSRQSARSSIPIFRASGGSEAAGGLYSQRLSGFVNGNFASSEQRETPTEAGLEGRGLGLSIGIDYRFGLRTFLGLAPQFNNLSASLKDDGSELKANQIALIAYGSHFLTDAWYVEGSAGGGNQTIKLKRHIGFTAGGQPVDLTALGDTKSAQKTASIGTGYEFLLPQSINLSMMANLVYATSSIDSYTEENAGALNLMVGGQTVSSKTTQLSASLSRAFSFKSGVLIPQLGATWLHELVRDGERLQAQFAADTAATQFGFVTPDQDANYFILNADVQFLAPGGRVGFLRLSNVRLLRDRSETGVTLGGRMEF